MVNNAGNDQGSSRVEYADLGSPFDGMGFSCGCSQSADAWHVKADRKDKRKTFCLGKVGGQNVGDTGGTAGNLGAEGGAYEIALGTVQRV